VLEHAWTTHDVGVTKMLMNAFLHAYKDDPRFIAFTQKVRMMPKAAPSPECRTAQLGRRWKGSGAQPISIYSQPARRGGPIRG